VEEQMEEAETALLARNGTRPPLAKLLPTIGQPKLWWLPAVKAVKPVNASAPALKPQTPLQPPNASAPRLPPWAPASLFLHWPAVRAGGAAAAALHAAVFCEFYDASAPAPPPPHLPPPRAVERTAPAAAVRGRRAAVARGSAGRIASNTRVFFDFVGT
jgi:hypothetical protein